MEDSSHELIDQMIAEEQYCYGFDAVQQITNVGAITSNQTQKPQLPILNTGDASKVDNANNNTDIVFAQSKETKAKKGKRQVSRRFLCVTFFDKYLFRTCFN